MHFFLKLFWLNNNLVCRFKINKSTFIKGDNNQWCCSTALWWRNKTQQAHWPESKGFWEWRADGTLTISRWSSTGTSDVAKDLQVVKHVKEKQIWLLLIHVNTWIYMYSNTTLNSQVISDDIGPKPVIHKAFYGVNQVEKQTVPMW